MSVLSIKITSYLSSRFIDIAEDLKRARQIGREDRQLLVREAR